MGRRFIMNSYYEILNIRQNAALSEIKIAYKRCVHKYHPDINRDDNAAENFKLVMKAYKVLTNPILRAEYDSQIKNSKNYIKDEIRDKYTRERGFLGIFSKKDSFNILTGIIRAREEIKKKKFISREKSKIIVSFDEKQCLNMKFEEIKIRFLNSENCYVRANAAKLFPSIKGEDSFTVLIHGLKDSSYLVRQEVILSLGVMKEFRAVNFIINSINDSSLEVRVVAVSVLRNFPDTRSVTALLRAIESKDEKVIIEAIYSLGVIGDSSVVEILEKKLLETKIKPVRKALIEVLNILK
jgi:hypothetical protein